MIQFVQIMPDKNTLGVDICNGTVGDMKELDVAESFKSIFDA